jgi:hypothetical protein
MSGYTKLFSSIVTSTVWCEDHATLRVWIAMLAVADATGRVEGSVPGFASLARVTLDEMRHAIEVLSSPDRDSRTPDHEGRRIESVDGGWIVLNYLKYRDTPQGKDGSRAPYFRERRAQQSNVARNSQSVVRYTEAEAEAEAEEASTSSPLSNFPSRASVEQLACQLSEAKEEIGFRLSRDLTGEELANLGVTTEVSRG